jgi:hypothetical protein
MKFTASVMPPWFKLMGLNRQVTGWLIGFLGQFQPMVKPVPRVESGRI